eukprot:scaffold197058_cov30-Tisochrysis_lutea.AAC.3
MSAMQGRVCRCKSKTWNTLPVGPSRPPSLLPLLVHVQRAKWWPWPRRTPFACKPARELRHFSLPRSAPSAGPH